MALPAPCTERPTIAEHPAFMLMLRAALAHYRCTLGELREDYWLHRLWRALTADPLLEGRIARQGVATVLLTGSEYGPPESSELSRARLERHVRDRVAAETGRTLESFGVGIQWADEPVAVSRAPSVSLLAQLLLGDSRWDDLAPYAGDLAPVMVPVATAEAVAAA
jgi:hypothetical protein